MTLRNQVSILVFATLIAGSLFLTLPEKGFAGVARIPLCCQNSPDSCFDNSGGGGPIKCKS